MKLTKLILRKIRDSSELFWKFHHDLFWKFRHIFDKKWAENYISEESISHPHRKLLIDIISKYFPFKRILEIGCASGPNLYLLAKKFPNSKFYGIDISVKAIKVGENFFKEKDIKNVFLKIGKAEDLKNYKDKSIDVIFTDACLIYEKPKKIDFLVQEMFRVARKAIILCGQHTDFTSFCESHWVHNYKLLFGKFLPEEKIKFTKITPQVWGGQWGELGYIIEIIL